MLPTDSPKPTKMTRKAVINLPELLNLIFILKIDPKTGLLFGFLLLDVIVGHLLLPDKNKVFSGLKNIYFWLTTDYI